MNALYKTWSKTKKPLFNMLKMQDGLQEILNEEAFQIEMNKKKLEMSGTVELYEAFVKELIKGADSGRKARSKFIRIFYKGVLKTKGWIQFNTPSQYTPGKKYYQYVKLLDIKDIDNLKDLKKKDIIRLLLAGNVSCYCSCPDFLYKGFKYMGYNMGYGVYKEMRYPKIKNPNLEGTVCKHMLAVLQVLSLHWLSIHRDMTDSYYWKNRYKEGEIVPKK
jgi:hypothetical protein